MYLVWLLSTSGPPRSIRITRRFGMTVRARIERPQSLVRANMTVGWTRSSTGWKWGPIQKLLRRRWRRSIAGHREAIRASSFARWYIDAKLAAPVIGRSVEGIMGSWFEVWTGTGIMSLWYELVARTRMLEESFERSPSPLISTYKIRRSRQWRFLPALAPSWCDGWGGGSRMWL